MPESDDGKSGKKKAKSFRPDTPAAEAARAVLDLRLEAVEDRIDEVGERGASEPRAVHQMRVATRRASAALRVFDSMLPDREVRRMRKRLRKIRRAGAEVRQCDVQTAMLGEVLGTAAGSMGEACAYAIGRISVERTFAMRAIKSIADRGGLRDLRRLRKATMGSLDDAHDDQCEGVTLEDLAQHVIPETLDGVRTSAHRDLTSMPNVHALRLAVKRLRYDLEILAPGALSANLDESMTTLTALQNRLGAINDLCELVDRLTAWVEDSDMQAMIPYRIAEGLNGLAAGQRDRLSSLHEALLSWRGLGALEQMVDEIAGAFAGDADAPDVEVRRVEPVAASSDDARSSARR